MLYVQEHYYNQKFGTFSHFKERGKLFMNNKDGIDRLQFLRIK